MKKLLVALLIIVSCMCCIACGGTEGSSTNNTKGGKGTKDNPYTLDDTITISSYTFETDEASFPTKRKTIGENIFELSNLRIEEVVIDNKFSAESGKIKVFVFDKKCIQTCLEDGLDHLDTGDIGVDSFFNPNMQILEHYMFIKSYTGMNDYDMIYFDGTTYTQAYAMADLENGIDANDDEVYDLVRIHYYDKDLEDKYIYIKLN